MECIMQSDELGDVLPLVIEAFVAIDEVEGLFNHEGVVLDYGRFDFRRLEIADVFRPFIYSR
jgi:hypothetical protein